VPSNGLAAPTAPRANGHAADPLAAETLAAETNGHGRNGADGAPVNGVNGAANGANGHGVADLDPLAVAPELELELAMPVQGALPVLVWPPTPLTEPARLEDEPPTTELEALRAPADDEPEALAPAQPEPIAEPEPEVIQPEPIAEPEPEVIQPEPIAQPEPEVIQPEPIDEPEPAPLLPRYESWLPSAEVLAPPAAPPAPAAGSSPAAAPETPEAPSAADDTSEPSFVQRGRMRRRARYLRQLRELQLRDIGGFAVELHRYGRERAPLVQTKIESAAQTDQELRALQRAIDGHVPLRELREPGIGGACASCGAVHGSQDRFCSACGAPLAS
jgi:hypothetical protein